MSLISRLSQMGVTLIALIATTHVFAATVRLAPVNFGTILNHGTYLESTNSSTPPFGGGVSLNDGGDYQAILEIDVTMLNSAPYYYLELSPRSVWYGGTPTEQASVLSFIGDGLVTLDDYNVGSVAGTVPISVPSSDWYTPNDIGGYVGDSYFDITLLVADALINNQQFLGLNIRTADAANTGILFKQPTILASDLILESRVSPVPLPAAAWLFASALGVFGYLGKRKAQA